MKKQITHYGMLTAGSLILLVIGLFMQGCGQSSSERGSIVGPTVESLHENMGQELGGPGEPLDRPEMVSRYMPVDPCEMKGTANVVFISRSLVITYEVYVNGQDQGALLPEGNKLVQVPEGLVQWQLLENGAVLPQDRAGKLFAQRCRQYTVPVGLDRRTTPKLNENETE